MKKAETRGSMDPIIEFTVTRLAASITFQTFNLNTIICSRAAIAQVGVVIFDDMGY